MKTRCGKIRIKRVVLLLCATCSLLAVQRFSSAVQVHLNLNTAYDGAVQRELEQSRRVEAQRILTQIRGYNSDSRLTGRLLGNVTSLGKKLINGPQTLYDKFTSAIGQFELYTEDAAHSLLYPVLDALATNEVRRIAVVVEGTQLKFLAELADGLIAIIKPERPGRDTETSANLFYFNDMERHYAEVATFHVDRTLGFRRVSPCVLRLLSISKDIRQRTEDANLLKTFHTSPAGNTCFYGYCKYYCDSAHAFCGKPNDTLEVAACLWLPYARFGRDLREHPWRRSYSKRRLASWQGDNASTYCEEIRRRPQMQGRLLLDLIDLSILDFLIANQDRHHYCRFGVFRQHEASINHIDNGRAFGTSRRDEESILAPLTQCCKVRKSTYVKLSLLRGNNSRSAPVRLSDLVRLSFEHDPLHKVRPILLESHLAALDRRLAFIMQRIRQCIAEAGESAVLIDDQF